MIKIVHVVNQFFAGFGGEEKAGMGVDRHRALPARRAGWSKTRRPGKIVCTIYVGDNYFHEHKEEALKAILMPCARPAPDVLVAGPAFNSGRYGVSCVETCNAIAQANWPSLLHGHARRESRYRRISRNRQCAGLLFTDDRGDHGDE